ncbi:MAG: class I SAM-dependent methyltransferase [Firmicutes bacterium]|nr:class I SAM-dependent methyltransferase [Bacillota bacterium]
MNSTGNYAQHARFWDWSGHDNTEAKEYWLRCAAKYGRNVLIPMCAWGEAGAYMAERGFTVTAFDITPEMIAEGKKRYGDIPGLTLYEGDVTDFKFGIPPVDFCFSMDFGHLLTVGALRSALACIAGHMRAGGCLVIETSFRKHGAKSDYTPPKTFHPLRQVYPGIKVWKTGDTRNDAKTGRCRISQTFYAEHADGHIESFDHAFYLQSYTKRQWRAALKQAGFGAVKYGRRELKTGYGGGDRIEAVRV